MVKHSQTTRRQQPTNCLSVFDHFLELALKGLKDICNIFVTLLSGIIKNRMPQAVKKMNSRLLETIPSS